VQCRWCNKHVQCRSLERHYLSQQCQKQRKNSNQVDNMPNDTTDHINNIFCQPINNNNDNNTTDNINNNNTMVREGNNNNDDNTNYTINDNNIMLRDGNNDDYDEHDDSWDDDVHMEHSGGNTIYDNDYNNDIQHDTNEAGVHDNFFYIDMEHNVRQQCPAQNCPFITNNRTRMRKHFRVMHPEDIIIIKQEGLLPRCHECGLFQANVNTARHLNSEDCKKYATIKNNKRFDLCQKGAKNVQFQVNGEKIKMVEQFNYLGRVLSDDDNDLKAVESQLVKARKVWGRIGKLIKKNHFQTQK
jgi:hypothetical protein